MMDDKKQYGGEAVSAGVIVDETAVKTDEGIMGLGVDEGDGIFVKGEEQPVQYRDSWAAILFILQTIAIVVVAIIYAPYITQDISKEDSSSSGGGSASSSSSSSNDNGNLKLLFLLAVSYVVAGLVTMMALRLMMVYSVHLVKISFFVAPVTFYLVSAVFYTTGNDIAHFFAVWAVFISAITICCWFFYRHHVPFAAANLRTALSALRLNAATYGIAFGFSVLSFLTMMVWLIAVVGIDAKAHLDQNSAQMVPCEQLGDDDILYPKGQMCDKNGKNPAGIIILFFCFYWTQQVIQNVIHVTTAGVVGSWWFAPMADPSCCSPTVCGSLRRACTYSFGSICFGSLLVAIIQTLEQLVRNRRGGNGRGGGLLLCIIECILHCLRAYLEYFNSWAFVYVGLYGYPYIEAGKNVITLFKNRGWTTLIADRLVFRVLLFVNLGIAALCGCIACLMDFTMGPFIDVHPSDGGAVTGASHVLSFFIAFIVGFCIANVALFVVQSAVQTVIVCFAESPSEFEEHHPQLHEIMMQGWTEAYPTVFGAGAAAVV